MVSNLPEGMSVRLVFVVCYLRGTDYFFKIALAGGCMCLTVRELETSTTRQHRPEFGCCAIDILSYFQVFTLLLHIIIIIEINNFYY
jgi:hypothetical protein